MKILTVAGTLILGTMFLCAAPVSLRLAVGNASVSIDQAEARIGRPLTPIVLGG